MKWILWYFVILERNPKLILPKVEPATGLVWASPADVFATFFCSGVCPSSPGERKLHKCARPVERRWEGSGLRSAYRYASFWKPLGFNKFPLRRWRMKRWGFNLVSTCFKERGLWLPWRPLLRLAFNTWRYRSSAMRVAPKLLRRRQVRRQLWMDWSQLEREQRSCVPQTMFEPLDTWPSSIVQTLQTQVSQVWKLLSFESTSKPSLSVGESLWFI